MPQGKKRRRKRRGALTPKEKFNRALALKKATRCIFEIEDEYKIYVRLTEDFAALAQVAENKPFEGAEQCLELSEECRQRAEELKKQLPVEREEHARTVTTTAREREDERGKNGSKKIGKIVLLLAAVLVIGGAVAYHVTPARYYIAGMEAAVGLQKLSIKAYESLGNYKDSEEKKRDVMLRAAESEKNAGRYAAALAYYTQLAQYGTGDSTAQKLELEKLLIEKAAPGKAVLYGNAKWIVLEKKETSAVLIRKNELPDVVYHDKAEKVTWEDSTLRQYLNDRFCTESFLPTELTDIEERTTETAAGEEGISDRVYILDEEEFAAYDTLLTKAKINNNLRLRTPGKEGDATKFVSAKGKIVNYGFPVEEPGAAVHPVICVKFR